MGEMAKQERAKNKQKSTKNGPSAITHVVEAHPHANSPTRTDSPLAEGEHRKVERKQMTPYEWSSVAIGTVGVLVGIYVLCIYSGQLEQMKIATAATKQSVDIAAQSLAVTQRGYLEIRWQWLAMGDSRTAARYLLGANGATAVDILDGSYARLSIDKPPFPNAVTKEMRTSAISPRRVSPRTQSDWADIIFPVMTPEQQALFIGSALTVFISGTVRYKDAFPNTPVHRKYFGVKWTGKDWESNPFVRNDEEDEDKGSNTAYHVN